MPQLELQLLGGRGAGGSAGLLAPSLGPFVGLGHHLELGGQRRIANAPQLHLHRKKVQVVGGVLVQKVERRHMLGPKALGHPNHFACARACGVGEDLAQVRVVGLLQLVFDDHLLVATGAQNVQLELADPMLGGHQCKLGQAQRVGQRVEVVLFGQPGREVVGLVLPGFAQGDAFEFAERFFYHQISLFGCEANSTNSIQADFLLYKSSRSFISNAAIDSSCIFLGYQIG
mgnify:CR=1 FL=1